MKKSSTQTKKTALLSEIKQKSIFIEDVYLSERLLKLIKTIVKEQQVKFFQLSFIKNEVGAGAFVYLIYKEEVFKLKLENKNEK